MLKQLKKVMRKVLFKLSVFIVCHIPIGLFIIFKYLLNPEGFWQKFVVYGVGGWVFGALQVIIWVLLLVYWVWNN